MQRHCTLGSALAGHVIVQGLICRRAKLGFCSHLPNLMALAHHLRLSENSVVKRGADVAAAAVAVLGRFGESFLSESLTNRE